MWSTTNCIQPKLSWFKPYYGFWHILSIKDGLCYEIIDKSWLIPAVMTGQKALDTTSQEKPPPAAVMIVNGHNYGNPQKLGCNWCNLYNMVIFLNF